MKSTLPNSTPHTGDTSGTGAASLVSNELDVLAGLLPLQHFAKHGTGLSLIELGCGNAHMARELLELRLVKSVVGLEVDEQQHAKNLARPHEGLTFLQASAAAVPFADQQFDLALMLKSLHHVPLHQMGKALDEAARVLKPGGWFYVSEPVYEGALNDIVKIYNDEGMVRAAAQMALDEALDRHDSAWKGLQEKRFEMPARYASCAEFEQRMLYPTFADHRIDDAVLQAVRAAYAASASADGSARFTRPMHVRLLQKKA
jgi:ubiquinone/menaquinone biosynthesis C-methylase UbiE